MIIDRIPTFPPPFGGGIAQIITSHGQNQQSVTTLFLFTRCRNRMHHRVTHCIITTEKKPGFKNIPWTESAERGSVATLFLFTRCI